MKKNYSQNILKQPVINVIPPSIQSRVKSRPTDSPIKKVFQRKPQQGHTPFSRKKCDQVPSEVDSTMQQTNLLGIVDKLEKVRFVSCRSQISLTESIISKSSGSHSFVNFNTDSIGEGQECSRILPEESIIYQSPEKQSGGRELFRRKTANSVWNPVMNKRKLDQNSGKSSTLIGKFSRKMDQAQQQTKLQSSDISDKRQSFYMPSAIIVKNMVQSSKHSSKQSLRKSSSSNSIHKPSPTVLTCQQCDYHCGQLQQSLTKNQRLERMIKNKDDEISNLNKSIQEIEKRNRELERKVKDSKQSELRQKVKQLEQQVTDSQDECLMLKNAYSETLQQLKYKMVENTTMKKYQTQCEAVERKMQLLITQRNQLRQRLSSLNTATRSSYTNYPSSLSRQTKSIKINNVQNLVVPHSPFKKPADNKRQTYTSRNVDQQPQDFYGEEQQQEKGSNIKTGVFKKKQTPIKCYEESSQSEIISLSEDSNL